jgi:hypothetical protein
MLAFLLALVLIRWLAGGGSGKEYKSYFAIAQSCSVSFLCIVCCMRVFKGVWCGMIPGMKIPLAGRFENQKLELFSFS